jgi:hypothetical protein
MNFMDRLEMPSIERLRPPLTDVTVEKSGEGISRTTLCREGLGHPGYAETFDIARREFMVTITGAAIWPLAKNPAGVVG